MQYILFVIACLSGQPGQCTGETIALPEVTNATACHLAGRLHLRDWALEHPGMRVREAKCMGRPLASGEAVQAS